MMTRDDMERIRDLIRALWPRYRPTDPQREEVMKRLMRRPADQVESVLRGEFSTFPDESRPNWTRIFAGMESPRGPMTAASVRAEAVEMTSLELEARIQMLRKYSRHCSSSAIELKICEAVLAERSGGTDKPSPERKGLF